VKAKRSAQGTTASGTGAAASSGVAGNAVGDNLARADHSLFLDWHTWAAAGLLAVLAIALTLVCLYLWRKHGERAKAYAAAIKGDLETDIGTVLAKIKAAAT
jgi:hypothetical protein